MMMPPERPAAAVRPLNNRSSVSTGRRLLLTADGRGPIARRFQDIYAAVAADQGGLDRLTETRRALVRRFASTCVLIEVIEDKVATGQPIEVGEFTSLVSTAIRLAQTLGLSRQAKDVTPDLRTYIQRAAAPVPGGGPGTPDQPDPRAGGPAASSGTGASAPGTDGGGG